MKIFAFTILMFAFPALLEAGETINETLDVSATADISIEDPHGRIEIHAWDKNKVKVTGEISDDAKDYSFEKHGDNVTFEVEYEGRLGWGSRSSGKNSSKLTFYVPIRSRLDVSNINGNISVTGVEGGTSIETINGNITGEKLKQRISIESINGSITTKNNEGKINIETINGDVNDKNSSGKLSISTVQGDIRADSSYISVEIEIVNGDLELELARIDELSIESVNGKVDVSMHVNKKGEVEISNVNGSLDLRFNKDISADFQVDAFVGGRIVNELTADKAEKQKFGPGRSLQFSKDGGSAQVEVSTVSGKVRIGQR